MRLETGVASYRCYVCRRRQERKVLYGRGEAIKSQSRSIGGLGKRRDHDVTPPCPTKGSNQYLQVIYCRLQVQIVFPLLLTLLKMAVQSSAQYLVSLFGLQGKTVLITGGTRGIGAGLTVAL